MSTRLTFLVSLVGLLFVSAASAIIEPHGHVKAYLQDKVIRKIAAKGNLAAAMRAVGINLHRVKDEKQLINWAQGAISLAHTQNHQEVYNIIDKLVAKGFPGELFPVYLKELIIAFHDNTNDRQLIQVSPAEPVFPTGEVRYVSADRILEAIRMENLRINKVEFLLGMRRHETALSKKALALFKSEPHIRGTDITGPETGPQNPIGLLNALKYTAMKEETSSGPPVLRIHVGEGYYDPTRPWEYAHNVAVASQNPLRVLQVLDVATEHNPKYRNIEIILSHLTHIAEFDKVVELVKRIERRGANLRINTNPLSNITLKVAQSLGEIEAYRLLEAADMPDYTGSDNVYGIRHSRTISKLMHKHDIDGATDYANHLREQFQARFK